MTIRKLIKLDYYVMKPLFKFMIPFLIIPIVLGIVAHKATSVMVTLTFLVFLLNTIFATAEKSNFNKLYAILPIRKNDKIVARYLFSLLVILCGVIISLGIYIMLSLFSKEAINWIGCIESMIISIVIALSFISIQYPFYYKFEYSKATIMAILPYVVCFAIGVPLLQFLMKDITFFTTVMEIVTYFQTHTNIFVVGGMLLSIGFISLSCIISIKIQKKEF